MIKQDVARLSCLSCSSCQKKLFNLLTIRIGNLHDTFGKLPMKG